MIGDGPWKVRTSDHHLSRTSTNPLNHGIELKHESRPNLLVSEVENAEAENWGALHDHRYFRRPIDLSAQEPSIGYPVMTYVSWFEQPFLHGERRFLGFHILDAFSCLLKVHAAVPQQTSEGARLVILVLVAFFFPEDAH